MSSIRLKPVVRGIFVLLRKYISEGAAFYQLEVQVERKPNLGKAPALLPAIKAS